MYFVFGILVFAILLLIGTLWKYQRQVKDICRQLAFLKENESNMMITRDFASGGIGELTDLLNDFLIRQRAEKKKYLEKERMISDTYTNLSHDIRTPLTSLDGYFQLLEESREEEEQKRYLKIIQERIACLKEMLEELFTFARLKNDSYQMELSSCCINRVLKDTIFSYYEDWQNRGIEPELEIAEEQFYIMGNQPALRRVIQNVIKNGLDHGEKRIRIVLKREQNEIVLRIGNETAHPENIDVSQVFARFYKADEARSRTSTGLGLSIAKELVLRMNGRIEAELLGNEFGIMIAFSHSLC